MGSRFNQLLRTLITLTPEQKERWRTLHPEAAKQVNDYLKAKPGAALEAFGYEAWLKRLGPHTFTRPLAPIQHRFWKWNWDALQKVIDNEPLEEREKVGFLPWPRETGKSSHVEWACIGEGALLKSGYVIFLCGKLSQAIDHVAAIRDRIESEKVAELYPWLSKPKLGTHGNKFGWGQEFLITSGGWAIRPVGADVAMRGGKAINIRPTLIVVDDYDELGDSPHVVEHKEHMLTRAILPMGNANTRVLVPQNPIHDNSVVNRMLTGASLALAVRTVFGELDDDDSMSSRPIPAVKNFAYEVRHTDEGTYSEITQGESNWPGISREDWQATLNRVGPPAFEAEYQHNLEVNENEKVLPEYDDRNLRLHVITWSQFEAKYGTRRIPSDWPCDVGLDIGYTTGSHGHRSAWTFLAKVPEFCELAGSVFRYRGRTFSGVGIDDQAIQVRSELWPNEDLQVHMMSHEKLGERLTLNQKHGWHFHPCDSDKRAGISQWRHFLRPDRSQPHPFHRDEKEIDGLWKLGRPAWFDVVEDRQLLVPVDDKGLKRHRDGAFNWRNVPIKLTDKGLSMEQPAKKDDDENDSCFVAGTTITTGRGQIAIEQVSTDDVVLTRQGWYSVERVGLTSENAEIWTIHLSNGRRLSGTKRHPIWVVGYGWKPLSEIQAGERLLSLTEYDFTATLTQSTGHIAPISNRMFTRLKRATALSMLNCGKRLMGQFQTATQFITEIITHSIMQIQTLSFLQVLSTPNGMPSTGLLRDWSEHERICSTCRNLLKSGIEAMRGGSGTENMPIKVFILLQKLRCIVTTSFVNGFLQDVRSGISIARIFVSNVIDWASFRKKDFAKSAAVSTRLEVNQDSGRVLSVEKEIRDQPVYNLSVQDTPEYFADGFLVHNCRMLLSRFPTAKPMTQQQKIQKAIPPEYRRETLEQSERHPNEVQLTSEMAAYLARKQLGKDRPVLYDSWGQLVR